MPHQKCPNCNRVITCGCQRRVASNGIHCCNKCLTKVESSNK